MDQGQNWEAFAHDVDDRYARCGDLAEKIAAMDEQLDVVRERELTRTGTLDDLVKTKLRDAWAAATGLFEKALLGGLAIAVWNGVRRASGFGEMTVSVGRALDGSKPPFASITGALAFAEAARGTSIGAGPISSVIAETSDVALAMGRAVERQGRDRGDAGGFLPVEWMASSPTRAGASAAKNEDRVLLRDDVLMALDRSVDDRDIPLLYLVLLGEFQRVPAARALGDRSVKVPQYERVRLTMREAARRAKERGDEESEEAIKQRIGRAKDSFRRALEARKLIPIAPTRLTKPARQRAAPASAFGWAS